MNKSKKYLGEFEESVLLAILSLGENAYGVTIRETLEEARGRMISIGALYTTLSRLEAKALVHSWAGEPTPERGGRAKKFYQVSAEGKTALREAEAARHRLNKLSTVLG